MPHQQAQAAGELLADATRASIPQSRHDFDKCLGSSAGVIAVTAGVTTCMP